MSSNKVSGLVGVMIPIGSPSRVTTTAPSTIKSAHTAPGRAESSREAIIFMLNSCTTDAGASRAKSLLLAGLVPSTLLKSFLVHHEMLEHLSN